MLIWIFSEFSVHPDIWLHPGGFIEFQDSMDFLEFHSKRKVELKIPVMQNIFSFIHEIRHHFFSIKNIIIFKKVCLVPG